jgi:hypothetical protein
MCNFVVTLLDVPNDTIRHSLGQFLDATSVLALSSSCQYYHTNFQENNMLNRKLWRMLCVDRWRSVSFSSAYIQNDDENGEELSADSNGNPWQEEYRRRHKIDNDAWEEVKEINSTGTPFRERRRLCAQLTNRGMNVMDVVKRRRNSIQWHHKNIPGIIEECLVRYRICIQFRRMQGLDEFPDEYVIFTNDNSSDLLPLEYGAVLIARFYQGEGILKNINMESYIEKELNSLAGALLDRLGKRGGGDFQGISSYRDNQSEHETDEDGHIRSNSTRNYPMQMVLEEMKHFFQSISNAASTEGDTRERPFMGDITSYYSSENSMIHEILKLRKGIPLTLAIIYSAIVRRAVGINLNLMGLPGHFMLSTTIVNQQTGQDELIFVDAFDGGNIVTLEQVQTMITSSYQIPWSSNFLTPVSNTEVWHRMCRNLVNCKDSDEECIRILMVLGFNDGRPNFQAFPLLGEELRSMLCKRIYEYFP